MPNIAIQGGSPLGLIGLRSASINGVSTFNGGNTRNVNVDSYNEKMGSKSPGSLFTGTRILRAWPNIKGGDVLDKCGVDFGPDGVLKSDNVVRSALHNDTIYDTSILNIIEKLSGTKAELRPADFAFLKNIGVYPNNRLMVARRFAGPSNDNIMYNKKGGDLGPLSVMISWITENQDFLDISFGEEWVPAEADFKGILTSLGEDFGLGNAGGIGGAFGNILPLPGFTEVFQRKLLTNMGMNATDNQIPSGNPNLIKEAKRRKLVGYTDAGSGLSTKVSIKMVCEYELKFITGIDPTIVWMDLLGSILRFGTSKSDGYGLGASASSQMIRWANDPHQLTRDLTSKLTVIFTQMKADIFKEIMKGSGSIIGNINATQSSVKIDLKKNAEDFATKLGNITKTVIDASFSKYRVKIIGIINSLSGLPSTPWHITIGNPLRPVFCSGDMYTTNVSLKLGPILAFNDLPSSVTVEFTLENARPWGMQEIMAKFNSGYLRTVDVRKTYYETAINENTGRMEGQVQLTADGVAGTSGTSGVGGSTSTSTDKNSVNKINPTKDSPNSKQTSSDPYRKNKTK